MGEVEHDRYEGLSDSQALGTLSFWGKVREEYENGTLMRQGYEVIQLSIWAWRSESVHRR